MTRWTVLRRLPTATNQQKGPYMARVEFQVSDSVFASLHCDPERFSQELRLAAAIKWYERGMVS